MQRCSILNTHERAEPADTNPRGGCCARASCKRACALDPAPPGAGDPTRGPGGPRSAGGWPGSPGKAPPPGDFLGNAKKQRCPENGPGESRPTRFPAFTASALNKPSSSSSSSSLPPSLPGSSSLLRTVPGRPEPNQSGRRAQIFKNGDGVRGEREREGTRGSERGGARERPCGQELSTRRVMKLRAYPCTARKSA